jgi:hypothetical protein
MELVATRASDECGCPEEDWIIGMLYVTIHLEPDDSGHIFLDGGDWGEDEKLVQCTGIEDLRKKAQAWVESIGIDNNL